VEHVECDQTGGLALGLQHNDAPRPVQSARESIERKTAVRPHDKLTACANNHGCLIERPVGGGHRRGWFCVE
jgi:hypothetical protein